MLLSTFTIRLRNNGPRRPEAGGVGSEKPRRGPCERRPDFRVFLAWAQATSGKSLTSRTSGGPYEVSREGEQGWSHGAPSPRATEGP